MTGDLAQYTLAACRTLSQLGDLLDPWQPGLLRLLAETLGVASERGLPAGVCGEAASDELLACVLVGFGATSLSIAPSMLPRVRAALAARTYEQFRAAAADATSAHDAAEARKAARAALEPAGVAA